MIYCDTSVLVALLVEEVNSSAADRWIRRQAIDGLAASAWVGTELASALALKRRLGLLDEASHLAAAHAGDRLLAGLRDIPIARHHFVSAGQRFVAAPPKGLRSGDALHLAVVIDRGAGLATLDRQLAEAARLLGVDVAPILPLDADTPADY